jgi:predicted Fe-Mo cluster-binding NifX family protein
MKIAVTASKPELNSPVDPRFGRSPYFIVLDPDTMEFEAIENPNLSLPGGAGIQTAQLIANRGVQALLTGSCGPNAFRTLEAGGVEVFVGVTGIVKEAALKYKKGAFQSTGAPNVSAHHGMGMGRANPPEPGSAPGSGGGRGRFRDTEGKQEIDQLKEKAEFLKQQLDQITKRIEELDNKDT